MAVVDGGRLEEAWWQADLPKQGCVGQHGCQTMVGEEVTSAEAMMAGGKKAMSGHCAVAAAAQASIEGSASRGR